MVKHWSTCHGDVDKEDRPKFTVKVVASFKDALTRQIAESVRIDMRGGRVLNSKTEYSRCHLPRLMVEKPDWQLLKEIREREEEETERAGKLITKNDEEEIMMTEEGAV